MNKSHSTVNYILNKFRYDGPTEILPRRAKEKKITERQERYIVRLVKENPKLSAPKLRILTENITNKKMSNQTIRRVLWKYGYHGRITRKRPYVSRKTDLPECSLLKSMKINARNFGTKLFGPTRPR